MTIASARSRRSVVVSVIGITQTLAWASTYYLTAVFADPVAADLHISREWFFGVVSGALLLSGLLGPVAGRTIDRRGGRDVLAMTSVLFAVGLVLMSMAHGVFGLAVAWAVLGVGMGYGLYEAAFATVADLWGREARNAITGITLIAGFASTIGWPTSAVLVSAFGWRGACLGWAVLHLLLGLPMNRLLIPNAAPVVPAPPAATAGAPAVAAGGTVSWTMIVLASVFGVSWFVSASMAAHLPRLLEAMGSPVAAAVAAAALVGPAQVAARLVEFSVLRRASAMLSARLAVGLHPIGAVILAVVGAPAAIPFVLLHGAGNGMLTIARGTLPLALFGAEAYGLRVGLLAAPARILQGAAPLVFGLVLDRGGPYAALLLSGSCMVASFLALSLLRLPGAARTVPTV
ncbi:MAG TPA: MFS transporter [Acetobacteraceae bacterium]|jgi:MFS family permease|nr:MFS transporter [Acetobacteraceae bacterium]